MNRFLLLSMSFETLVLYTVHAIEVSLLLPFGLAYKVAEAWLLHSITKRFIIHDCKFLKNWGENKNKRGMNGIVANWKEGAVLKERSEA